MIMKTEHILLLIGAAYLVYRYTQGAYPGSAGAVTPTGGVSTGGGDYDHVVSCDAPEADPIMCSWLAQHQTGPTGNTVPVMVP
jgi:hypothetical protein